MLQSDAIGGLLNILDLLSFLFFSFFESIILIYL